MYLFGHYLIMKKKLLYLSIFLFLWLAYSPNIVACLSEPPSERYYVTFFESNLWGDTTYRPCYLDAKLLMPFEWDTPLTKKYATNLREWQYYCKNQPTPAHIATFIYELPLAVLTNLQNGKLPDSLKNNTFARYLQNNKDTQLLAYLILAKKCEALTAPADYWDTNQDDTTNTTATKTQLLADARNGYKNTTSDFLKLRYAYQIQKLDTPNAAQTYNELIAPLLANKNADPLMLKSVVQYWALAYKAGQMLNTKKNNAEALYLFAKCFLNDPEKRELYLFNFRIADQNAFDKALTLARTPDEKATLWLMRGSRTKELDFESLTKLYESNPSSPFLNLLLSRELNKIERQLLSPILMTGDSTLINKINQEQEALFKAKYGYELSEEYAEEGEFANKNKGILQTIGNFFSSIWHAIVHLFGGDDAPATPTQLNQLVNNTHLIALQNLVNKALTERKITDPALWQTASAYLHYLRQNYPEASKMASSLTQPSTEPIKKQALLIDCLARLANTKTIDQQLENDFAIALQNKKQPQYEYDNYGVFSRSLTTLAQKYLQQGNLAKAILCLDKAAETTAANTLSEFSASQTDLDALLQLADKADRTPFERFLLNDSRFDRNLILDIQGTKLLRNQQYDAALAKLNQIAPEYWIPEQKTPDEEAYYYDNFDAFTFTCNFDNNPTQPDTTQKQCNKLQFVQKVVSLLHQAQSNKNQAATYYYQLANGFFNTPFWGYNARLWQGSLVGSMGTAGSYPLNISPTDTQLYEGEQQFLTQYGNRKAAIDYYKKTIETSSNPEMAAKAAYLIKLSQLNPQASFQLPDTTDLTYTNLLQKKYNNTQFYADIIKQCPSLSAYFDK